MDSASGNDGNRVSLLDKIPSLQCPICYKPMKEPKVLSCGHSFCMICLCKLIHRNVVITCSICRKETITSDGKVEMLPTNISLKSVLEEIQNVDEACDICGLKDPPNIYYCCECNKFMCDDCKRWHASKVENRNHEVRRSTRRRRASLRLRKFPCAEHEQILCTKLCVQCGKMICNQCSESHSLEGHEIKNIAEFVFELDERGTRVKGELKEILKNCEAIRRNCLEIKTIKNDHIDTLLARIEEKYNALMGKLEKDRLALKETCVDLKKIYENMSQKLLEHLEKCKRNVDLVNSTTEDILQRPFEDIPSQDSVFLSLERSLHHERTTVDACNGTLVSLSVDRGMLNLTERQKPLGNMIGIMRFHEWNRITFPLSQPAQEMACTTADPAGRTHVGYFKGGVEISGEKKSSREFSYFKTIHILAMAFSRDCHLALRTVENEISIYRFNCIRLDRTFVTEGQEEGGRGDITIDTNSDIYVSYRNKEEIHVFKEEGGSPIKKISCKGFNPQQIRVMPNFKLVVMNGSKIRIMNDMGETKSEISRKEHLGYAAVGLNGTVYVAWVKQSEGTLEIESYNDSMETRTKFFVDKSLDLSGRPWYYLQVINEGKLSFCTPHHLHVFTLHERPDDIPSFHDN